MKKNNDYTFPKGKIRKASELIEINAEPLQDKQVSSPENAETILQDIKRGKAYSYSANLTKGRIFTIFINERGNLVLSANNLKSKSILNNKTALEIINNTLNG